MTGFEKLKEQVKDQQDCALQETVRYLLTRKDMEQNYLKEDKSLEGMCKFIKEKGQKHCKNGWNYITNEIVYSWAIMYYSLPNSFLKINDNTKESSSKKQINYLCLEVLVNETRRD